MNCTFRVVFNLAWHVSAGNATILANVRVDARSVQFANRSSAPYNGNSLRLCEIRPFRMVCKHLCVRCAGPWGVNERSELHLPRALQAHEANVRR